MAPPPFFGANETKRPEKKFSESARVLGSPAPQAFGGPDSTFGLRKNFGAVARSSCFAFCFFALVALFRCSLLLLLLVSLWLCCSIASRLACCLARVRWLGFGS
ncbi:MAG: hypothetical protein [Bacteriophage sp.]|nr:MAG: hypothetical protein [Bacteriophage sp.]